MVNRGLNEVNGSCGTKVISRPRTRSEDRSRSWPLKVREPPAIIAFAGSAPRIVRASVVLPQPDSPTRPMISPGWSERLTPSSTRATPASVVKDTDRSRTDNSSASIAPHPRIEHVAQPVTEQVEAHPHQQDRDAWSRGIPPGLWQKAAAFGDHAAPFGRGWRGAEA